MGSEFYYIKVKVIFPEDGVVKEFCYEKIQSYYHYHYNCSCISHTFSFVSRYGEDRFAPYIHVVIHIVSLRHFPSEASYFLLLMKIILYKIQRICNLQI